MQTMKRAGLGLALACLMGSTMVQTATAADKVSLFKVITVKDEIVVGLSAEELAQMDGNAGGVAKAPPRNTIWLAMNLPLYSAAVPGVGRNPG